MCLSAYLSMYLSTHVHRYIKCLKLKDKGKNRKIQNKLFISSPKDD